MPHEKCLQQVNVGSCVYCRDMTNFGGSRKYNRVICIARECGVEEEQIHVYKQKHVANTRQRLCIAALSTSTVDKNTTPTRVKRERRCCQQ